MVSLQEKTYHQSSEAGEDVLVPEGVRGGNAVIVKHFKTAVTTSKIHL